MAASFFRTGILRRAWSLTWSRKSLWFFGLFAAVLAVSEEYDFLNRNGDILDTIPQRLEQLRTINDQGFVSGFWSNLTNAFQADLGGSLAVLASWVISILAIAWLIIVSQAALIEGTRQHEEGKSLHVLGGFDVGMSRFWAMFLLNAVTKIVVYGLLLIVALPLSFMYLKAPSAGLLTAIMLWTFLVLFPFIALVAFVTKFAMSYIVLKKYAVGQAIVAAWKLFARTWLVTFELAAILLVIDLVVLYTVTSTLVSALNFPSPSGTGYLVFIVITGFFFAWLTTFKFAAWTNLFLRLEEGAAPSKLQRIINYVLDIRDRPSKPVLARAAKK